MIWEKISDSQVTTAATRLEQFSSMGKHRLVSGTPTRRAADPPSDAQAPALEWQDKGTFYRDLVEHSHDLLCVHTLNGTLLSVNEPPARLLGYRVEDLIGTSLVDLLTPEFRPDFARYIEKIKRDGVASGKMALLTRDGGRRIWEYYNTLRTEGVPEPVVRGIAHDVTERVDAERKALKHLQETALLHEIGQLMSSGRCLKDVLQAALEGVRRAIKPDLLLVFMVEGDGLQLEAVAGPVEPEFKVADELIHRMGQCLCSLAARQSQAIYSLDIANDTRCTMEECKRAQVRSFVALPLRDEGNAVLGVLGVASRTLRDFSQDAVFLETLATEISFAIRNSLLLQQAQNRADRLQQEVNEREQAEEVLRESELRFVRFVEASPMGIHIYRLRPGGELALVVANPSADKILGIKHNELLGKAIEEAFPALASTEIPLRYRSIAESGGLWTPGQVDYKDNEVRGSFEVHAFQVFPGCVGVIFADITQRVQSEEAVRLSEARLRSFIDAAPFGITRASRFGNRFLSVNAAMVRALGYDSESEVLGLRISDLYVDPQGRTTFLSQLKEDEAFSGIEFLWKRKDGKAVTLRVSGRSVHDADSGDDIIEGIVEDVTERHALQEQFLQAQKMEAVGRLAGGVAHDFNNMLSVILGYSELLTNESDPKALGKLYQIKSAARRATALTAQLLAFSRKQVLQLQVIDLNTTVSETHKMLQRLIGEDVQLEVRLAPGLWAIKADVAQLGQVLMNLAVNARDAMPSGGKLTVGTSALKLDHELPCVHATLPPGEYVVLSMRDSGTGMDPEVQAHIFDPFFTTKAVGQGTGLGLATVYRIVQQAKGYINFSSEPSRGTTFEIYFPRSAAEVTATARLESNVPARGCGETILLAEDTTALRDFLSDSLGSLGYKVLTAADGAEALRIAAAHAGPIHLLLTDVIMPNTSGPTLASGIVAARPDIKVLYMSGYTDDRFGVSGELEASSFIQKPFQIAELTQKIRGLIGPPRKPVLGQASVPESALRKSAGGGHPPDSQ